MFWVEVLAGFVADGFDTLVLWPVDTQLEQVELLAQVRSELVGDTSRLPTP